MTVNIVLLKVLSVLAGCYSTMCKVLKYVRNCFLCVYSLFFLRGLFYIFTNVVILFVSHHMLGSYCLC